MALLGWWRRWRLRRAAEEEQERQLVAAIERVVEESNPRIRAISGYRRELEPAVERAVRYVRDIEQQIPGPVPLDRETWSNDPVVNALFGSVDSLREVISRSRDVRRFFAEHLEGTVDTCFALLFAEPSVRKVLGTALVGDTLRKDVRKTTVSFAGHGVAVPAATEAEFRSELKQLALQTLVGVAVANIARQESAIGELEERHRALRLRKKVLDTEARGLDGLLGGEQPAQDREALAQGLARAEEELSAARKGLETLDDYLIRLSEILSRPEEHLGLEKIRVRLDRMNVVQRPGQDAGGQEVEFTRVRRSDRPGRVVLAVRIPRGELLPEGHFLRKAERYMG